MSQSQQMISDLGFCPHCGSILPLPIDDTSDNITCMCGYKINCTRFDNMILSKSEIIFNEITTKKKVKSTKMDGKMGGPSIERKCGRCGHNEMTYKTRQMRSADEGMSIFYHCVKCGWLEKEDS